MAFALLAHFIGLVVMVSCGVREEVQSSSQVIPPQGDTLFSLSIKSASISDPNSIIGLWESVEETLKNSDVQFRMRVLIRANEITTAVSCDFSDGEKVVAQVKAAILVEGNGLQYLESKVDQRKDSKGRSCVAQIFASKVGEFEQQNVSSGYWRGSAGKAGLTFEKIGN